MWLWVGKFSVPTQHLDTDRPAGGGKKCSKQLGPTWEMGPTVLGQHGGFDVSTSDGRGPTAPAPFPST
jgi:hypothetical protein